MIVAACWLVWTGGISSLPPLPWILSLPRELVVGIAGIAALALLCFWLLVRAGRRRFVTLQNSDAVGMISFQLARIADAMERLSIQRDPPPEAAERPAGKISMSMFGR